VGCDVSLLPERGELKWSYFYKHLAPLGRKQLVRRHPACRLRKDYLRFNSPVAKQQAGMPALPAAALR